MLKTEAEVKLEEQDEQLPELQDAELEEFVINPAYFNRFQYMVIEYHHLERQDETTVHTSRLAGVYYTNNPPN